MKNIYGVIGLFGFFLVIGSAGGADNADFKTTVLLMLTGLVMLCISPLLIRIHKKYLRRRRFSRCCNKSKINFYKILKFVISERTSKISERWNSLKLC